MLADEVVDCHVLVIGSGGAGVRAAIEASQYGETVLISKTIVGKGGCTTMAEGGYNAVLREQDSCGIHYEDTLKGGAYLNDPELVNILTKEAPLRMGDLVKWGAVFDFTDADEIAQRPFGGQRFPRTCYAGDRTGHEMMVTLVERLDATGVTTLQEYTVIDLLKDGDAVIGAMALDEKGNLVLLKADSTVLATGGGTRVYDISTNSSSGTGDGFAMGYRAGAELIDMEMVQFHPTGAVFPYRCPGQARDRGGPGRRRGPEERERGAVHEELRSRTDGTLHPGCRCPGDRNGDPARAGARSTAGVYLDVTHLSREQIELRLPVMLEQFLKFGVDIRTTPMEVAPTAHHMMGGLRITPACRTTCPGLFACGEVAGGVHGANRLGGNALAETQVFGKRAGESAGKAEKRQKKVDNRQVETQQVRLAGFLTGNTNPAIVRRELQLAMWNGAGIFRTAPELEKTLQTATPALDPPPPGSIVAEPCRVLHRPEPVPHRIAHLPGRPAPHRVPGSARAEGHYPGVRCRAFALRSHVPLAGT